MNKHSLQLRGYRIFLSTVLLFLLITLATENAWSQSFTTPQIPKLSLTGADDGYNTDWYPDGRIWLPPTKRDGAPREFLMPVFIDNKWWHYKSTSTAEYLVPEPIYSFRFKILYDGVAITPVDIVTTHPFPEDDARATNIRGTYVPPLAKDWSITWKIHKDETFHEYFVDPGEAPVNPATKLRGRVITISGSGGNKPLPCTDTAAPDFNILLYVKFRVNLEKGKIGPDEVPSLLSPVYISPDSIYYNDWNVRKVRAFNYLINHPSIGIVVDALYPDPTIPQTYVGLAGMINRTVPSRWAQEPSLPGAIWLQLTDDLPKIWYNMSRPGFSDPPVWDSENNPGVASEGMWVLRDPLTVDSGKVHKPDYVYGSVKFVLQNSTPTTRLLDVYIEADAPWLTFRVDSPNRGKIVQMGPTQAYVYYIDNGILGQGSDAPDPLGNETEPDDIVEVTINCDPDRVIPHNGEKAGIYEGYITFRSHTADINPVRFFVTFVNFRNPFEPDDGTVVPGGGFRKQHRGVTLTLRNSRGLIGDETKVVFGTGHRATESFDTLFGEFPYPTAMTGFGARLYHPDEAFRLEKGMPFGFGDMLPNRTFPFSESRDIRDINDTNFSHIFLCRFDADGVNNYPVVVEWDTTDFPEGAQLFLSDTLAGALFPSVNMRQSTHVAGNMLSYAFQDPSIKSFKIEYTLPRIINYVDAYGNPKIKKGWNLLSLPVRPYNYKWNVVYPNALNRPFSFFGNGYQDQELVTPGIGYFIKYSDSVDYKFKGVPIKRITKDITDDGFKDEVKLFPGWNTIGALTFPMNTKDVAFDQFIPGQNIDKNKVFAHGFWGYKTNVGYFEVSILDPGLGYWMKATDGKHGFLKLIHPDIQRVDEQLDFAKHNILKTSTELVIRDNAQHETSLFMSGNVNTDITYYELPPVPMEGLFDARFYTNTILENKDNSIIKLQGIQYPVSIAINKADANYTFLDSYTNEILGSINKGETKNIEIEGTVSNSIKVLKSEIITGGLSVTNYPNPVVISSTINYSVPSDGFVSLKLYDAIGNVIALFEGNRTAGAYSENLDASKLASGSYLCKLTSGSNTSTVMITVVK
ncbi:MAG: T9SS type A sorting domain-containing protein [bacterium]